MASHIEIIEDWAKYHTLSKPAASIAGTVNSIIKLSNVFLVESLFNNELLGFAILSVPGSKKGIILQNFSKNISFGRIGDSLMDQSISFTKKRGLSYLHLGYSASSTLKAFKKKWGASWQGPGYRFGMFALDKSAELPMTNGTYFWRDRLEHSDKK